MPGFLNSSRRLKPTAAFAAAALLLAACAEPQLSQFPEWMQGQLDLQQPKATSVGPAVPVSSSAIETPDASSEQEPAAVQANVPPLTAQITPQLKLASIVPTVAAPPSSDNRLFETPSPSAVQDQIPRVAILLPLSGPNARLGQAMLNAAQLALFHFADRKFELLPHDTKGTPDGAADAAALAIGDGVSLILGPLLATSVRAVAPASRAAGVVVLAFSNDRDVAGDGVFTMGFLPSQEVRRVIEYANHRGLKRFAALAPDNEYGRRVVDSISQAASELGAVVTQVEHYDPLTADFAPTIRRLGDYTRRRQSLLAQRAQLKSRTDEVAQRALARLEGVHTLGDVRFDALLIADGGKRLQAIAALLPYYDIDPKRIRILGTGQWDVPGLGTEPAMVGSWFAAPPRESRKNFVRQYTETFGSKPPRLATLAYDATALGAVLTRGGGRVEPAALMVQQGFAGRDGIFRFLSGGVAERGLTIMQIDERATKVVQRAPASFAGN